MSGQKFPCYAGFWLISFEVVGLIIPCLVSNMIFFNSINIVLEKLGGGQSDMSIGGNGRGSIYHSLYFDLFESIYWNGCSLWWMTLFISWRAPSWSSICFSCKNPKQLAVGQCMTFQQEIDAFLSLVFHSTSQASCGDFSSKHTIIS